MAARAADTPVRAADRVAAEVAGGAERGVQVPDHAQRVPRTGRAHPRPVLVFSLDARPSRPDLSRNALRRWTMCTADDALRREHQSGARGRCVLSPRWD